jgi:hypothetical protein
VVAFVEHAHCDFGGPPMDLLGFRQHYVDVIVVCLTPKIVDFVPCGIELVV